MIDFLAHPASLWAAALGLFGGGSLVLVERFSRRGPLLFPVYAALLAALTVLLASYSASSFRSRFGAAFLGFVVAAILHYIAVGFAADEERRQRGVTARLSLAGHAWRLSLLLGLGMLACAGVAFVAA